MNEIYIQLQEHGRQEQGDIGAHKAELELCRLCGRLPITIGFSRNVGRVLKTFDEGKQEQPAESYRFYM